MCDLRSYEMYGEDEYFLKFLMIHPNLYYSKESKEDLYYLKFKFQSKLLNSLHLNIISKDNVKEKYLEYKEYSDKKNNNIVDLESNFKNIINNMKSNNIIDKIDKINNLIDCVDK
jgi:hypothetical protein